MKIKQIICAISFVLFALTNINSQVKLPKLISDGMVLQRNANVKIWGWALPGEKVSVHFKGSTFQTKADDKGDWSVKLPKLSTGGPFTMVIKASNTITINNILVGDVWVCSGQSNMEMRMERIKDIYKEEIQSSENPNIRSFTVTQEYDFSDPLLYRFNEKQKDLKSNGWSQANPQNVTDFSATAYFFAREIYEKYHVPKGIINTSLGGAPAEAWISEEASKEFLNYYNELQQFKDTAYITNIQKTENARSDAWFKTLRINDEGYKDTFWFNPDLNTSAWSVMQIPGYWANTSLGKVSGVFWFRKTINIPDSLAGKEATLYMGTIVDSDSLYINGTFVGTTGYMYPPRIYIIPAKLLKAGNNTIVARVISNRGDGGFVPEKPYGLLIGNEHINLKGEWQFRIGAKMEPLAGKTSIRMKPVGLYNSMLCPLVNYRIKGVIWYQGESNIGKAVEYRQLFQTLIKDWRKVWNQGNFPFLFVQLPNFKEAKKQPTESDLAMLREAQLKALSLPNTGMAIIIELGEWNDIHPVNKKEVGRRLALVAQKVAYGNGQLVFTGPMYKAMKIEGDKIKLTFTNVGSGLIAKGTELKYFAIAGADMQFVWAKAKIENDTVVVWNEKIPNPVAVRYAWADNPEGANLYNKEGLPASPFRTDE